MVKCNCLASRKHFTDAESFPLSPNSMRKVGFLKISNDNNKNK